MDVCCLIDRLLGNGWIIGNVGGNGNGVKCCGSNGTPDCGCPG